MVIYQGSKVEPRAVEIRIDKSSGSPLGVVLGEENLVIEVIEEGLIANWNKEQNNPGLEMLPGDVIVSVNGVRDVEGIFSELQKPQFLVITFQAFKPRSSGKVRESACVAQPKAHRVGPG